MQGNTNSKFQFMGVNHLAPACRDMKETVEFYNGVLGMPLTLTTQYGPDGREQQVFFFDIGNGTHLAFMWAAEAIPSAPGIASPAGFLEEFMDRDLKALTPDEIAALPSTSTAVGSMNHIALNVPVEKLEEYRQTLMANGVKVSPVTYHVLGEDCCPATTDDPSDPSVFMQSIYFHDPNGIQLEFAGWTRTMQEHEAALAPLSAVDVPQRRSDLVNS
jgi:catechol 2,3-dioxygenase-like lactoylglutathione lyase family enzyme